MNKILQLAFLATALIALTNSYNNSAAYGESRASIGVSEDDADRYMKFRNELSSVLPTNNWDDALDHMSSYFSKNKSVLTAKTSDDVVAIWQLKLLSTADRAALGSLLGRPTKLQEMRMDRFVNEFTTCIGKNMQAWTEKASAQQLDNTIHKFGSQTAKLASTSIDNFNSLRSASSKKEKFRRAQNLCAAIYLIQEYQNTFLGKNAYQQKTMAGTKEYWDETQATVTSYMESVKRLNRIMKLPVCKEILSW